LRSERLPEIEGLRAYLALWVVAGHVLWASGYEARELAGIPLLIRSPELAVDLFIVVSGFVIFLALDTTKHRPLEFVVRRFFRLYPVFALVFLVAIPVSKVMLWNAIHGRPLGRGGPKLDQIVGWWDNIVWHVPLHLTMLHGLVPEHILPDAPGAFLIPGWSISLEWQFYLVAPLAFAWATGTSRLQRVGLFAICAAMMFVDYGDVPSVRYGAALPYKVEYFFLGAASWFVFKHRAILRTPGAWFALAGNGVLGIYLIRGFVHGSPIPTMLWVAFLGLILEPPSFPVRRLVSPLLTNPVTALLGRVSYGVYLSHLILLALIQAALLTVFPELGRWSHAAILFVATAATSVPVSIALRRYVELPGIEFGRRVARALGDAHPAPEIGVDAVLPTLRPTDGPDA
jgi:peptidoglycan/LPS O-acetylase OafA/YrhL